MAKKKEEKIDRTIVHPEPDTSPNEATADAPPATWDPGKSGQPEEVKDAEREGAGEDLAADG